MVDKKNLNSVIKLHNFIYADYFLTWDYCYLFLASFIDDMPRLVQGDSARVVQIFANLISNSLKFTTCK